MTEIDYKRACLDFLQAPYLQSYPIVISTVCKALDHPEKFPPGSEPKFNRGGCPCGHRRPKKMEDM